MLVFSCCLCDDNALDQYWFSSLIFFCLSASRILMQTVEVSLQENAPFLKVIWTPQGGFDASRNISGVKQKVVKQKEEI